ncbi:hypothetical protein PS006_24860, partial [Shigella sonnei]|nr:hypothetical protein [Shigella sonnei]
WWYFCFPSSHSLSGELHWQWFPLGSATHRRANAKKESKSTTTTSRLWWYFCFPSSHSLSGELHWQWFPLGS